MNATEIRKTQVHEWTLPAYNLRRFEAKVEQANRRLARAGLNASFDVAYERYNVTRKGNNGETITEPWVRATLNGPLRIAAGHYTFVANLVPEEAGITVHTAPGQELGGYEPRGDFECEHCKIARARTRLYLVRDNRDGRIIQLGHNCIELYTGVAPKGLWALTYDEELTAVADEDGEWSASPWARTADVDWVLAYAWAHSDEGRAYVPSEAYEISTATRVRTSLFLSIAHLSKPEQTYYAEIAKKALGFFNDKELLAAIKAGVEATSPNTDYGRNLRVLLAGERVSERNVGLLASLVKVFAKEQERRAEQAASPAAEGFIGEVGQRLRNLAIQLTAVRKFEGAYGPTTLFVGRTADGHVIKWFASGNYRHQPGNTLYLQAATVKAHEHYQGEDQTVITRGKIDPELTRQELNR